ncbi:hypothetical protein HCN44_006008 [Aphidius gifuensis]|uniref:DNA topoisomerase n=1 Tax=Aphidius gifuensis TaxID=684658 RepID=A0A834Y448_APHGI|nr:hypothetical protein HCN44_006008 [Aphidius gifuensis]
MKVLNVSEKNDTTKNISALLSRGNSQRKMDWLSSIDFDVPVTKPCPENFTKIKRTLEREIRQCDALIIWTDCDREGENIDFEIINVCQAVKRNIKVYRAKFSEITNASITRAIQILDEPQKNVSDEHQTWGNYAQRVLQDGITPRAGNEAKVYEFIVRHFLACISKNAEGYEATVDIDIAEHANLIDEALAEYLDERPTGDGHIGMITPTEEVPIFKCPKCGQNMELHEHKEIEKKYIAIILNLWNENIDTFNGNKNDIIVIKNVKISEYQSMKNLVLTSGSTIKINPDIPEANRLKKDVENIRTDIVQNIEFIKIDSIQSLENHEIININAVVEKIGNIVNISSKDGRSFEKKEIILIDDSRRKYNDNFEKYES